MSFVHWFVSAFRKWDGHSASVFWRAEGSYTAGEGSQDGSAISSPVCGKKSSLLGAV